MIENTAAIQAFLYQARWMYYFLKSMVCLSHYSSCCCCSHQLFFACPKGRKSYVKEVREITTTLETELVLHIQ